MIFLAAGLCSFLTIYRPVLRAVYDGLEAYLGFLGDLVALWQAAAPFILADYANSMLAAGTALGLALLVGLPAGVLAGARPNSAGGTLVRLLSSLGIMTPTFMLALAIMVFFVLYVLPLTGVRFILLSSQESTLDPRRLLPVALTLAARPLAYVTSQTAAATREALAADYIRTAHAKGLAGWQVLAGHMLPNIGAAVAGTLPPALLFTLGSLPIIEFVFNWPGVGQELLYRIVASPQASVAGAAMVGFLLTSLGMTYMLAVVLAAALQRVLDPRSTAITH
ncbi:MAG TPA: ABC transporter permease subunit [Roseiflexaceae bacterium]|nr:ABC transporter permease subunit [Roseiflexaceae bacterium]HMP39131.1 ABC transporter permease subunit [Roseiflexaceae bacterium]